MSDKPIISRRSLLRGATIAAPTILTLHSGAALAQTSNLITTNAYTPAVNNKHHCLDASSVDATTSPNQFDVGNPPMARVTRITANAEYYRYGQHNSWGRVTPQQMCANGGMYDRKGNGWKTVTVNRGGLVSATALSSFSAGNLYYKDV